MSQVKIISLGFMNSEIIRQSVDRLYETKDPTLEIEHHFLWQHYPLNKEKNFEALKKLCKKYKATLHDAGKNLGLHEGFNYLIQKANCQPGDIVIAYDLDSYPIEANWDRGLVKAIQGAPDVVWASLMNPRSRKELLVRGYEAQSIGDLPVWKPKRPVVNSISAFSYDWLKVTGWFTEPLAFYGLLEIAMSQKLKGRRWVFLPDHNESDQLRDLHDRKYIEYKWAHAHEKSWPGDFASWLKAGAPLKNPCPKVLP